MKFLLIDQVLSRSDTTLTAIKNVTAAEEYLGDHFPGFPVLPGVFMLEALTQAARELLKGRGKHLVLGQVKALRYGSFVRPGEALKVEVTLDKVNEDGSFGLKGLASVVRIDGTGETAVSGRFTMRPARIPATATAGA
ncbi:MAG: polyketide synthase dehydratase domain-containing protein [Planctomycetaceae bacterium]|jgi:3-hydroxyacyl-[acyl-carrier-protein] dehydratase|nr:polyketide synthase dehydratase domain-containing protein [Planctomycetaceae bacterium]